MNETKQKNHTQQNESALQNVLYIRFFLPTAHFRIPFTYQRRHTYPLPPYSTIIGFLCNLLGINNRNKTIKDNHDRSIKQFKEIEDKSLYNLLKDLKISIAGQFESKITEMYWFRNISKEAHNKRFGYPENRYWAGHIEHFGGQSPAFVDTLNNYHLHLHFFHTEKEFLDYIKLNLENPINKLEPLHLGRAEDIFIIEEISFVNLECGRYDGNYKHFFWIPQKLYLKKDNSLDNNSKLYQHYNGLNYRLTTFWDIQDYEKTNNRHGLRIFNYLPVKLSDGVFTNFEFYFDKEHQLPVFLANLKTNEYEQQHSNPCKIN